MRKRYAIIENGIVTNTPVGSRKLEPNWVQSDVAKIGDLYDEQTGEFTTPPAVALIPASVTNYQARIAMLDAGVLQDVEIAVNSSGDDKIKIAYAHAPNFRRASPFIEAMRTALTWTNEFVDGLFIAADLID